MEVGKKIFASEIRKMKEAQDFSRNRPLKIRIAEGRWFWMAGSPTLFCPTGLPLRCPPVLAPPPTRSRTSKTLASEPPEQRRLCGGSHGGRRLQRNGHGVRSLPLSLPPSSRLSPAYHAKVGEALLGFVSIGTAFANPSLPSNERASAIVY